MILSTSHILRTPRVVSSSCYFFHITTISLHLNHPVSPHLDHLASSPLSVSTSLQQLLASARLHLLGSPPFCTYPTLSITSLHLSDSSLHLQLALFSQCTHSYAPRSHPHPIISLSQSYKSTSMSGPSYLTFPNKREKSNINALSIVRINN